MSKPIFLTGCILAVSIYGQALAGTNIWGLSNINKTSKHSNRHSAAIVRANQQSFKSVTKRDKPCKDCQLDHHQWFVQLQGGAIFPLNHGQILVANGADFPAPENVDIYSTHQSTQGTIALTVGNRIATQSSLINHYTLSGRFQYQFSANVGNTITEYSSPEFLNYNYNWKLAVLALTADTKLNLFNFSKFSPYVNGGLGVSFNQAQSYTETALPDVTARISPAYANHTLTQFTYHVGAGLDFSCTQNWLLSAGYEFESWGHFASGRGKSTWSGESLQSGTYQGNTVLVGITYLMEN